MKKINLLLVLLYLIPVSLLAQFQNLGGPAKGQTIDIVFVNDTMYALTTASLQYSTNNGTSWNMVPGSNDLPSYLSNVSIDGDVIYLSVSFDYLRNVIFKTENFGQTWTQIQEDSFYGQGNIQGFDSYNDTLYIYSNAEIFMSADRGNSVRIIEPLNQNFQFGVVHNRILHFEGYHYFLGPDELLRTKDFNTYEPLLGINTNNVYRLYRDETNIYVMERHSAGKNIYKLENDEIVLDRENLLGINLTDSHAIYYDGDIIYTIGKPEYTLNAWEDAIWISFNLILKWPSFLLKIKDGETYLESVGQLYRMTLGDSIPVNITNNMISDMNLSIRKAGSKLVCDTEPLAYYDIPEEKWHLMNDVPEMTYFLNENMLVKYDNVTSKDSIYITSIDGQVIKKSKLPNGNIGYSDHLNAINDLIFASYRNDSLYFSNDLGETWQAIDEGFRWPINVNIANDNILIWSILGPIYTSEDGSNITKYNTTQNGIRKVTIDEGGNIYYMDFGSVYKYNQSTDTFDEIPMPFVIPPNNDDNQYSIESYGNALFVGGYGQGLFISYNSGETWESFNEGLESRNISSIEIDDQYIYVGTYGHVYKRLISELTAETIYGEVFEDVNENGIKEMDEPLLADINVRTTENNIIVPSNEQGQFSIISTDIAENKIEIIDPPYASATNGPILIDNSQNPNQLGLSFDKEVNDVGIKILSPFVFRPGFDTQIELYIENLTYEDRLVDIELILDEDLIFISTDYSPYDLNGSILSFDDVALSGRGSTTISLILETEVTSTIGDMVKLLANVNLKDYTDVDLSNNEYELIDEIRGSYDPNDKLVFPNSDLTFSENLKDQELIYTIRFQNTGNYPAEFVRLRDTIETDLDIRSLEVLSYSHPCEWEVRDGRILEVYFPNINLPDSTVSEVLSQGYVTFKMMADENVMIGTTLENKASIYFDYNPPIVTETVVSKIVESLSNSRIEELSFSIVPNPASNFITLNSVPFSEAKYSIIDASGRTVASGHFDPSNDSKILINQLVSGQYILLMQEVNTEMTYSSKFVKM